MGSGRQWLVEIQLIGRPIAGPMPHMPGRQGLVLSGASCRTSLVPLTTNCGMPLPAVAGDSQSVFLCDQTAGFAWRVLPYDLAGSRDNVEPGLEAGGRPGCSADTAGGTHAFSVQDAFGASFRLLLLPRATCVAGPRIPTPRVAPALCSHSSPQAPSTWHGTPPPPCWLSHRTHCTLCLCLSHTPAAWCCGWKFTATPASGVCAWQACFLAWATVTGWCWAITGS